MNCLACGNPLAAASAFCNACGRALSPPYPVAGHVSHGQPHTSGMAVAGFVLSFFCGLLGLILSIMASTSIKESRGQLTGDGLATAGIVISIINMVLGLMIAVGGG